MAAQAAQTKPPQGGQNKGQGPRPNPGPMGFLNPERVPALAPKYANKLGKTIDSIAIVYSPKGISVQVAVPSELGSDKKAEVIDLATFHQRLGEMNAPTEEQKLRSMRNKYELRLNKEFPSLGPKSGKDADLQAFMDSLPFKERRALLMSQKDFEKSYPEGFRA